MLTVAGVRRKQALFTISVESILVVLLPKTSAKHSNQSRSLDSLIYL